VNSFSNVLISDAAEGKSVA